MKGRLRAADYVEQILVLSIQVVPMFQINDDAVDLFMQSNFPLHGASISAEYFDNNNIPTLPWPAAIPDVNSINNAWSLMKRQLKNNENWLLMQMF